MINRERTEGRQKEVGLFSAYLAFFCGSDPLYKSSLSHDGFMDIFPFLYIKNIPNGFQIFHAVF